MPLSSPKVRSNTGRTAGTAVVTGHYDSVNDASGNVKYVDVDGQIWTSFADVPSGSSGIIIDNVQGDSKFIQLTMAFRYSGAPSSTQEFDHVRTSSAKIGSLLHEVSGGLPRMTVRGGAVGTEQPLWATSACTLALNTSYLLQAAWQIDTASTGKAKARVIRRADGVTMASGELTNLNNGTGTFSLTQFGKLPSSGTVGLLIDDLVLWDNAYEFLDPVVDAPELVLTNNGPFWMFDARGSSGSPTAYTIEHLSGPDSSADIVEPVDGLFMIPQNNLVSTYNITATGSGGTDIELITVPAKAAEGQAPGTVRRRVWTGTDLV